ncbi:MAG TPA: alkyl hydroperoxide reductase subunit F [Enhygromyxa sp.]|nr:alkyl hydroperoxide reductase subunit F [Enhygromyxa sp.]
MLDEQLQQQLRGYLERLRHSVRLTAWLDDSEASAQTRALLDDLARASSKIEVVERDDAGERRPSFAVHRPEEAPRIRFAGLPLGHEFTSLVLALLHVGGHPPKESEALLEQVRALPGPLAFETYFSQSCQNCPEVVQALDLLAVLNPNITHVAIDGGVHQAEVEARHVMAVPTIFLNGERFGQGRMELGEILAKLDTGLVERRARELDERAVFDMLIVGGGPAGAAAAIYAARKGIDTGIVTERFGGQVLDTLAIENFISVSETDGPRFAAALEAHVKQYPVEIIQHQRAKRLIPGELPDDLIRVELESGATLKAQSVVLATGARWRNMNVPGEQEYRTRGVTYCPHCDGPLFKGKRVAVIGGGNSGVEAAIDLAGVVAHVTVLEFMGELKADEILQRRLRSLPNVEVIRMARTTEVLGNGTSVTGLEYEDRHTGERRRLELEGVFVQIGLLPNTEWLKGTVELAPTGEIIVDAWGRTSLPGVFAAGDATTVPFKQIIIATGDGAKAALGAFDYLIRRAPSASAA